MRRCCLHSQWPMRQPPPPSDDVNVRSNILATERDRCDGSALLSRSTLCWFLFAASVLLYHAQVGISFGFNWSTAGFILACALLVRPVSGPLLVFLGVCLTVAVFRELPFTNTNRIFELFISATMVCAAALTLAKDGFRRFDNVAWIRRFEPVLRLEILMVYFFSFWHKLNYDFLDPSKTCVADLYGELSRLFSIFPWPSPQTIARPASLITLIGGFQCCWTNAHVKVTVK